MKLFNRKTAKAAAGLLAGMMAISSASFPVTAAENSASVMQTEQTQTGKLALPSAGLSYALSTQKISLREVEDSLYERGLVDSKHVVPSQQQSVVSAAVSSIFNSNSSDSSSSDTSQEASSEEDSTGAAANVVSASVAGAASAAAVSTADSTDDGSSGNTQTNSESAILQTNLTPVQMKEETLVKESSDELAGVDEPTATSLSTGAVSVVSSTQDALARKQAEDAEAAAKQKAAEAAAKAAAEAKAAQEKAEAEAAAKAEEEKKAQEEAEQKAKENPLVVSTASDYVNVRKEPSEDSEIVGKLYSKDVGKVQEESDENGWIKITSGDVTGYVKSDYVATGTQAQELAEEVGTQKAVVNTETLLVRAAPDAESDVIDLVGMGSALNILDEENGWYKVRTDVGEGYISSDFTDVEVEYPQAISKAEEDAAIAAQQAQEEAKKAQEEAEAKAAEEAAAASQSSSSQTTSGSTTSSASNSKAGSTTTAASSAASSASTQQETSTQSTSDTSADQTTVTASSSQSTQGQAVVNYALQFVGNPYVWGGSSLTNGTDCSGFTMAVYAHFGVSLPHYDAAQRSVGIAVGSLAEAQPGDLICYYGHVGIYIGNGQIVHASNPRDGIKVSSANYRSIAAIRRIFY